MIVVMKPGAAQKHVAECVDVGEEIWACGYGANGIGRTGSGKVVELLTRNLEYQAAIVIEGGDSCICAATSGATRLLP